MRERLKNHSVGKLFHASAERGLWSSSVVGLASILGVACAPSGHDGHDLLSGADNDDLSIPGEFGRAAPELGTGDEGATTGPGADVDIERPLTGSTVAPPSASNGSAPSAGAPAPGASTNPVRSAPRNASMLGYNMDYPGDWTNVPPFIDQMRNARAFRGDCSSADPGCDQAAHLNLDANGWPRSLAYKDDPSRSYSAISAVVNTSNDRPDIGQTFVVTWSGKGRVVIHGGSGVAADGREGRLTFSLSEGNTVLALREIDAADPVRDLRIFRADYEPLLAQGEVFDPEMLEFLAPFGSLRFMDWMQSNAYGECSGGTNAGEQCYAVTEETCGGGGVCVMAGRWDQRPTADQPSALSWGQYLDPARPELGTKVGGYPVETMVALANRAGVDPHFNIPAHYDDEYVRNFGEYVKANLGPGLTASVEYSNEVWNWGFPQAQYANVLGQQLWPDEGSAWVQYAAGRTSNMCGILKEVFAGEEERLRCLISPQTDWKELAETVLECPAWVESHPGSGPCYENVDAINITGYFSGCLPRNPSVIQSWMAAGTGPALDRAFQQLEHGGVISGCSDNLDETIAKYSFFHDLADARGLGVYVYESGTHFDYHEEESVRQFFVEVTQDERMYEAYQRNFGGFREAGGSVLNVWGWVAPNDAWANSESLEDRTHPKYRAIVDFVEATP